MLDSPQFPHCLDTPRWIRVGGAWLGSIQPWQQLCLGREHQRCSQALQAAVLPACPTPCCKAHCASIHKKRRGITWISAPVLPGKGYTQPQSNCTGCLSCYWAFFLSFPHKYFFTHIFGFCKRRQNSSHAFKKPNKNNQY